MVNKHKLNKADELVMTWLYFIYLEPKSVYMYINEHISLN
jgi:hypothetical protein